MSTDVTWHYDDDIWPAYEPECYHCNDSGYVGGRFGWSRRCPSCNPTRVRILLTLGIRWQVRRLVDRMIPGRRLYDDEAPF